MNRHTSFFILSGLLCSALITACGGDSDESSSKGDEVEGSGGAGTGGTAGTGGGSTGGVMAQTGGTPSMGGTPMASGGVAGGGGMAMQMGGAPATGGAMTATGGMISGGGMTGSGGSVPGTGGAAGGPPVDASEFTFESGTYSVAPGSEVFKCQDFPNSFGADIGITETITNLVDGSHHMFAFVLPNDQLNLTGALVDCPAGGLEFHEYLTTSANQVSTITYPEGVGRVLNAATGVRLMVHLLNVTTEPQDAFVNMTIRYTDPSQLEQRAASIFLNNIGIQVPPGTSTETANYTLPTDVWMLGAGSHMHQRGVRFLATTSTGETLIDETEWADAEIRRFDPPVHLAAGTTITWACTYENPTGETLGFGESAASHEMCIFPGEFYNQTGAQITSQQF